MMSESMSANHRRRHANSSKSKMCDLEASSSSLTLIREDATNALCPPPKTTRRRSSRRENDRKRPAKGINGGHRDRRKAEEAMSMDVSMSRSARCQTSKRTSRRSSRRRHERKRPEKGHGGYRDGRKTERRASTDASVVTPSSNPRSRSKHRDPSSRDSPIWDRSTRAFCRSNDEEERRELVEKEIKHVKKNAKVDHRQYDSMNPKSKRLDLSSRKHRRHAHKIDEEQYVSSSSPVHNKLEYSDSLWDGSRTCKCNINEEERREVEETEIKHGTKNAKVDHCEYDSSESTSKRLDLSNRKHGRHARNINEKRYVSSSSPMHNKLESSEYYKNDKIKSMHGGSPRRSKQLVVHRNNGRNKNRIVADHRTYIGPSMFLDQSDRSFAHQMMSKRLRRDQQWKEGRLKRLKNKMAIIFHHHHHHHHRHGRLVEVLERLARYVWRPEKGVAGRRGGVSGLSGKSVKQLCLWGRRGGGGGGGVKVGGRRQPVLLLSRRRSQKKMVRLGDKKGKRS